MKSTEGSIHISGKPDEQRRLDILETGETVSLKQITHRWKEPAPEDPKAPHIANGSAKLSAPKGEFFCAVFLGRHPADEPITLEEIEKRLNKLGWFRRDNG